VRTLQATAALISLITSLRADIAADFPFRAQGGGGIAGFASGPFQPAQTFFSLASGELQFVSIALALNGAHPPNQMVVDFRETRNGNPSTVVATALIDGSHLEGVPPSKPVMLTADFSDWHISLVTGNSYAFSLRTDANGAFACGSGVYPSSPYPGGSLFNSFDFGATWTVQPFYDLSFQVTTVPEPAVITLLGTALLTTRLSNRAKNKALTTLDC